MADVSVLEVRLYGESIGTLTRVAGDRTLFAFDESYIAATNRPVLGLGFKDTLGELITGFRPYQTRLMPFFSNLLPEGHMRTYLAEGVDVNPEREFFLLQALGADLPGAVTVTPAEGKEWPSNASDGDDPVRHDTGKQEKALRFSLAGVQLKFSAVNETTGGLTIPARGQGGEWIIKLPPREYAGVPENEYSMMMLARLIGMDVPATELVEIDAIQNLPEGVSTCKGKAFAIERFDRLSTGNPVHTEDFAQVFGIYPKDKYSKASTMNIASVLAAEGSGDDIAEFIRRLTFNALIGNADMHVKNWSVIYPDKRQAAIAPAYDFVSTIPYIPDEEAALKFSRTKRFDEFSEDELAHLAARALLPETHVLEVARETVALFHQHWGQEKKNLPLANDVRTAIDAHAKKIPLDRFP